MNEYILTVGLEIHAELKTKTKMFCDSKNDPDETRPNVNICPVCMGHPGTLPVINKEAMRHVLRVGLAIGGTLADFTEFDRKNYFYPDIPKGYQLSQYEFPLVSGGTLGGIAITRVHLEEDTATSLHEERDGYSLIDFNRAGVPLMELVTEPVIKSAKQAGDFARELQLVLRYLGASEANMEKGEMRVEANISVSKNEGKLGTKVEVKNLNSFRAVERAVEYEAARHASLLDAGEGVIQETRGWDENAGKTFSQRRKEETHDYRYFPDPDLPKIRVREVAGFAREELLRTMPELPSEKRAKYRALGIKDGDAEVLTVNRSLASLFEAVAALLSDKERLLAASYITSDLVGLIKKAKENADGVSLRFTPEAFAMLIRMAESGRLSSRGTKDILQELFVRGGEPERIAAKQNLLQKSDAGELESLVKEVLAANPKVADDYRSGKTAALKFLIGLGMKESKGAANPEMLRELFEKLLK